LTDTTNKLFSKPVRKWAVRLFSVLILAAFVWHFRRLSERLDWSAFGAALTRPGRWKYLALACLLMPLNWWLEARKWHLLLRPFLTWPFARTWRATLAGLSVSAATPNRIGEIGGRLLVAEREEWPGVITSSLLGGVCQWVAFLLLAWPALMWTADGLLRDRLPFAVAWLWPVGPLLLLIGWWAGLPLVLRFMVWLESRFKLGNGALREALANVKMPLMAAAGTYACVRFSVYCTQLWLLLWFFGLELSPLKGLAGIAGIYLVQAGIPMPPGVNLVTRTELGLLLWGDAPTTAVATVAAFTTLFAVNVLLPALPGYLLIVKPYKKINDV